MQSVQATSHRASPRIAEGPTRRRGAVGGFRAPVRSSTSNSPEGIEVAFYTSASGVGFVRLA
jgi:hypothetical protein